MHIKRATRNVLIAITIFLVVIITLTTEASDVWIEKSTANNGASLIKIVNNSPNHLYCWVTYQGGYFDFYVQPYQSSRWYYEPSGYYEWRCQ